MVARKRNPHIIFLNRKVLTNSFGFLFLGLLYFLKSLTTVTSTDCYFAKSKGAILAIFWRSMSVLAFFYGSLPGK